MLFISIPQGAETDACETGNPVADVMPRRQAGKQRLNTRPGCLSAGHAKTPLSLRTRLVLKPSPNARS
jgi:hypothetical protein